MKTILFAFLTFCFSAIFVAPPVFSSECPKSEEMDELKKEKRKMKAYKPPAPAQGGATGNQKGDMGRHAGNTGVAGGVAAGCIAKFRDKEKGFIEKFKKLKEKFEDPKCSNEKEEAEKQEKEAERRAKECESAAAALGDQKKKGEGNEDKMGDDSKKAGDTKGDSKGDGKGGDDKKGGDEKGGGGAPPPMPPPPQKKDDSKKKEAERLARQKECEASALRNYESEAYNCVMVQFPITPGFPEVPGVRDNQTNCKRNAELSRDSKISMCKAMP